MVPPLCRWVPPCAPYCTCITPQPRQWLSCKRPGLPLIFMRPPAHLPFTRACAPGNYGPPEGFAYEWASPPIMDDPRLDEYNVQERCGRLAWAALQPLWLGRQAGAWGE